VTGNTEQGEDLTRLSLEELSRIRVTSVSKRPEGWFQAPAAVSVITSEDVRRSGVTSLPAALRLAPGMNVAQVSSYQWAISARGFNDVFSRMLLVIQDGRTLYTHLYSGVLWEMHDMLLDDMERIEVIRGPNAALWGANAVNGVVNITSKNSRDTQGLLVTAAAGTELQAFGGLRYGGKVSEDVYYRAWVKSFQWDDSGLSNRSYVGDAWWQTRGGARVDWYPQQDAHALLQAEIYGGCLDQTVRNSIPTPPYVVIQSDRPHNEGGSVVGRWKREWTDDAEVMLQSYYNHYRRTSAYFSSEGHTFDVEGQHCFPLGNRQEIVWGLNYRFWQDDVQGGQAISFRPATADLHFFGGFLRNEITIVPRKLQLTLGARLEHNNYSNWEFQPAARLAWTPQPQQTWWAAVSRAVRTPTRADWGLRIEQDPINPPGIVPVVYGRPGQDSESVIAYELGWRLQPHPKVTSDLALFYNFYDDLRSLDRRGVDFSTTPPELRIVAGNNLTGETYGAEWTGRWQALPWWRLETQYTLLRTHLRISPDGNDPNREENAPRHQVSCRSTMDLPRGWAVDAWLRWVDCLPMYDVPSYFTLDLRLAWMPSPRWEFAVVGQNLLDPEHTEFQGTFTVQSTAVQRSVYGKVTFRF
jgi:iron complex outermembrane receptor protein